MMRKMIRDSKRFFVRSKLNVTKLWKVTDFQAIFIMVNGQPSDTTPLYYINHIFLLLYVNLYIF